MIIWMLWKNRNDAVWNGARVPQELVVRTEGWLQEYQKWHKTGTEKSINRPQIWRRAEVDWVKCSFDGAWIQQGSRGGFGAVMRDHGGVFIAAAAS